MLFYQLTLMSFYIQFYRNWCKLCFVCFDVCVPVYFLCCNSGLSVTNKRICYVMLHRCK